VLKYKDYSKITGVEYSLSALVSLEPKGLDIILVATVLFWFGDKIYLRTSMAVAGDCHGLRQVLATMCICRRSVSELYSKLWKIGVFGIPAHDLDDPRKKFLISFV
jgi:hypothetical protein